MPYISTEEVKEIRKAVRKALPDFKVSVRKSSSCSSVSVTLVNGPVDFDTEYSQINHYYFKEHYKENPAAVKVFETIMNVMNGKNHQHETQYDSDYGSIPNYYQNIQVGSWNKPYEVLTA